MFSLRINGWQLPSPTEFDISDENLYSEETGRDETGHMHLDLIRGRVNKWKVSYAMLSLPELEAIRSILSPTGFAFTGIGNMGTVSCNAYAGSFSSKLLSYLSPTEMYFECSFSIIEM